MRAYIDLLISFTRKSKYRWLLHCAVTTAFVFSVNRNLRIDDVGSLLNQLRPAPILVVIMIGMIMMVLNAARWRILLRHHAIDSLPAQALRTVLWGATLGLITPGRVGELLKGVGIDHSRKRILAVLAVTDRVYSIAATAFFGLLCTGISSVSAENRISSSFMTGFGILNALAVAACIALLSGKWVSRTAGRILGFSSTLSPSRANRMILKSTALSLACHLLLLLQTGLVFRMLGSLDSFHNILAAGRAYALMGFLPISIANMGVREYSFALFLGNLDHEMRAGLISFSASYIVLVTNIIIPALIGLIWNIVSRTTGGSIKSEMTRI